MTASLSEPRALDALTREAVYVHVEAAKARGWSQEDLRRWFGEKGVELSEYLAAKRGEAVADTVAGTLAMVSITGLPDQPPGGDLDELQDVPEAMKAAKRWLLWKSLPNADTTKKPRKVPFYVTGRERKGTLDAAEDVEELATYADACAVLRTGGYAGLGFALGPDRGGYWQGIDLDNLEDHPGLQFVVDDLPGYVEKSPSGRGVHAIGFGREFRSLGSNSTGIEAYAKGRYFTVTGESAGISELTCLADFVERRLAPLHDPRPQDTSARADAAPPGSIAGALAAPELRSALASMSADDYHHWIRMGLALKGLGEQGRALWLEWSQTSDKFDPSDAERRWDGFSPNEISYKSVFAEAQRGGWVNPGTGAAGEWGAGDIRLPSPATSADDLFEVLSIADLRALPEAEWLVKDAIPSASLGFIYGAPGSFKSFVCYDLALTLAYGMPEWLDRAIKPAGSVLYIANEGAAGAQKRITAWQRKYGIAEDSADFHLIRKSMSFMSADDVGRLERTVAAHTAQHGPVGLIFVDTVSRVLPGADENLQKDMTVFVSACDRLRERFEAAVIGVHHTNKNGDMRGSTVFLGQGDFVFRVDKDEDRRGGVLTCEKQKDAEDGWKVSFDVEAQEWIPTGRIEPVSSLVLAWGGKPEPVSPMAHWPKRDTLQAFQRVIADAFTKGAPLSMAKQTKDSGRFAVDRLSTLFDVKSVTVNDVLTTWLNNAVLEVGEVQSHSKLRGLKVVKWLD